MAEYTKNLTYASQGPLEHTKPLKADFKVTISTRVQDGATTKPSPLHQTPGISTVNAAPTTDATSSTTGEQQAAQPAEDESRPSSGEQQQAQQPAEEETSSSPTQETGDVLVPRMTKSTKRRAKAKQRALAGTSAVS